MNDAGHHDESSGKLPRDRSQAAAPVVVDCAAWDAAGPPERWCTGKLNTVSTLSTPTESHALLPRGALQMEIGIQIEPQTRAVDAFGLAAQLVAVVLTHEIGHAITYDPSRSRTEADRAIIALTLDRPEPNAEARLAKIAELMRETVGKAKGIQVDVVRISHAA